MTTLPAGYAELPGVAMHVAELRRHTTDVHRFMKYLPLVQELEALKPGSDAWRARLEELDRAAIDACLLTMREWGEICLALADDLEGNGPEAA